MAKIVHDCIAPQDAKTIYGPLPVYGAECKYLIIPLEKEDVWNNETRRYDPPIPLAELTWCGCTLQFPQPVNDSFLYVVIWSPTRKQACDWGYIRSSELWKHQPHWCNGDVTVEEAINARKRWVIYRDWCASELPAATIHSIDLFRPYPRHMPSWDLLFDGSDTKEEMLTLSDLEAMVKERMKWLMDAQSKNAVLPPDALDVGTPHAVLYDAISFWICRTLFWVLPGEENLRIQWMAWEETLLRKRLLYAGYISDSVLVSWMRVFSGTRRIIWRDEHLSVVDEESIYSEVEQKRELLTFNMPRVLYDETNPKKRIVVRDEVEFFPQVTCWWVFPDVLSTFHRLLNRIRRPIQWIKDNKEFVKNYPCEAILKKGDVWVSSNWMSQNRIWIICQALRYCMNSEKAKEVFLLNNSKRKNPQLLYLARRMLSHIQTRTRADPVLLRNRNIGWIPPHISREHASKYVPPKVDLEDIENCSFVPACVKAMEDKKRVATLKNEIRPMYGRIMADLGVSVNELIVHWGRRLQQVYPTNPRKVKDAIREYRSVFSYAHKKPETGAYVCCNTMIKDKFCPYTSVPAMQKDPRKIHKVCAQNLPPANPLVPVNTPVEFVRRHLQVHFEEINQ